MVRPFAASEMTISSTPVRRFCRFLTIFGFEGAVAVARHGYLHRTDVGQDGLGAFAVAGVAAVLPGRIMLVISEVVGDLAFQGGLQQPLGQLLQQPALAGQLQALGLGAANQLVDQLVVHGLRRRSLRRLDRLGLGHVLTGHRCIFTPNVLQSQ
ncbi:hypothetical protein GCM10010104_24000 [Streptomyces indiaensis]|uniref:Uncharacterized protein n=1 Tax=Streptomyces indiaensis TaxID=284033 RepID=A0ABN3DFT3_9ACTN